MNDRDLYMVGALEACLFAAPEPLAIEALSQALGLDEDRVESLLEQLENRYTGPGSGIRLLRPGGKAQVRTREEYAEMVEHFLEPEEETLSPAAMEALALIAYRQPITRPEVDEYRGVGSAHLIRRLEAEGLIAAIGRKEVPGRPKLYGTTERFLQQFGLEDLDHLPPLSEGIPEDADVAE